MAEPPRNGMLGRGTVEREALLDSTSSVKSCNVLSVVNRKQKGVQNPGAPEAAGRISGAFTPKRRCAK